MSEKNTRISRAAISSFICGLLFIIPIFNIIFSILALIFGVSALKAISKYSDELSGKGFAIAGIIMGIMAILLYAVGITFGLLFPDVVREIAG